MRLAIVFPDAESFRHGMAVEAFEHYKCVRKAFSELESVAGRGVTERVMYPRRADEPLPAPIRAAAVLTASVGLYRAYLQTFDVPGQVLVGKGTGLLAAMVCAGSLDLKPALRIAAGGTARRSPRRVSVDVLSVAEGLPLREPKHLAAVVKAMTVGGPWRPAETASQLRRLAADTVLEIGPGDLALQALNGALAEQTVRGALDRPGNQSVLTDTLDQRKLFNPAHLAQRVLGVIAGTPDRVDTPQSRAGVRALHQEVRALSARTEPTHRWDTPEVRGQLRWICDAVVRNHQLKGLPEAELAQTLERLERDTLLPVRRMAGPLASSRRPEIVRELPRRGMPALDQTPISKELDHALV